MYRSLLLNVMKNNYHQRANKLQTLLACGSASFDASVPIQAKSEIKPGECFIDFYSI